MGLSVVSFEVGVEMLVKCARWFIRILNLNQSQVIGLGECAE